MIKPYKKVSNSVEETMELGIQFSKKLQEGSLVVLHGSLGSGKTAFVKGVLDGFNYSGQVTSPTYTLVNEYNSDYNVIHIDCYREKNINRWLNIGFVDYLQSGNIVIIEWPENIDQILPNNKIRITFEVEGLNRRLITFYD